MPHLSGYVRFLDYTFKPEGSAAALVRAVRAFAAAGIHNNILALFDNDTAAAEALSVLNVQSLPSNFRVLQLPEIEIARAYPTIGPTGPQSMDVNGLAVSIELFLGADALQGDDGLEPIQWTGYSPKMSAYQGEVLNKAAVQARFESKVESAHENGLDDKHWGAMRQLLDAIVAAFD